MPLARLTTAASLLALVTAAAAQDLMLFPPETFGKVILPQKQSMLDVQLEAQVGAYNNEFVSNYGANSVFVRTGRAVGMLQILTNVGHAPCTGFLVDGNKLITNHHCVPGILKHPAMIEKGANSIAAVQFHAGFLRDGIQDGIKTFHVNPVPLETSEALDYTVLQVLGDANAEFGALELSAAVPSDRDPFWVIGHPMGEAQRISREKCQADSPAVASQRLRHTCDTLPGNSGSPVIDAGSQQVIGLHHAGSRAGDVNFAVPMAEILAQSMVLKASSGGEAADTDLADMKAELTRLRAERAAERDAAAAEVKRLADEAARRAQERTEAEQLARAKAEAERKKLTDQLAALKAERDRIAQDKVATKAEEEAKRKKAEELEKTRQAALNADKGGDADILACDSLAGSRLHPDHAIREMRADGIDFKEIDATQAISACEAALKSNPDHPRMLAFLGRAYAADGQNEKAIEIYTRAAELGDPVAQTNLGVMYDNGLGVSQSFEITVEWYRKAADQGFVVAQYNLGVVYEAGRGVAQSYETAAEWYRKAADQGFAQAQTVLGWMYTTGTGVETSPEEAAQLYIKALQGGYDALAIVDLASWSPATAMAMQQELKALGHYSGPIDGKLGATSVAAMHALLP